MRFYVPEWDDHVDGEYDFIHDEHSAEAPTDRDLQYIWDIFDMETTPVDGVLISREQVEESEAKAQRLTEYGVYSAPKLSVPEWMPTISDCGAWGYKSLPFPPYGNGEMLSFYESMDVTTGVTIDHLVLGSEHRDRLYLDARALGSTVTVSDLPERLLEDVEVMAEPWPDTWPDYVENEASSIYDSGPVEPFDSSMFDGSASTVLSRLRGDSRAVYREDDMQYRFDLTLRNAAQMREAYDGGDYSFRLMAAIQGWNPKSYADAARQALNLGYDYIGIGGAAGSPTNVVKEMVTEVGTVVKDYERGFDTRVDTHVFGFAKTGAFDTIGRSGMTSFDSASMLRSAWTGGANYHLDADRKYDAIRVRYGSPSETLAKAIEKTLRGQELLHALRAFDRGESISEAVQDWYVNAGQALSALGPYLAANRHDEQFGVSRLREVRRNFKSSFEYGDELAGSFGDEFERILMRHLRASDTPEEEPDAVGEDIPRPAEETALLRTADDVYERTAPAVLRHVQELERSQDAVGTFEQVWGVVENYATWLGDETYLDAYRELLRNRPWEECDCKICTELGIEVAIFRGNNRNRRRGFHNTRRFYDIFEEKLPKILVATPLSPSMYGSGSIEEALFTDRPAFWEAVHDLPVAEVGGISAEGFHEWWTAFPDSVSLCPSEMETSLPRDCLRYGELLLYSPEGDLDSRVFDGFSDVDCSVTVFDDAEALRSGVLDRLDYEEEFVPTRTVQAGIGDF